MHVVIFILRKTVSLATSALECMTIDFYNFLTQVYLYLIQKERIIIILS